MNRNGRSMSKEELQQKVEEKREEIAHTVDEIRHTLTDEVRERKQHMKEAMDWRYYVKKHPVAVMGGAVAVGFLVGKAIGNRAFDHEPEIEPNWSDRARDRAEEYKHRAAGFMQRAERNASGMLHRAERKVDEMRGRAQGENKWKARSRSWMSSGTDLLMKELMKTAQHMIVPTVVAAVTGKMASDNKTTIVEKNVHKTPAGMPDREYTTNVTEVDNSGNVKNKMGTSDDPLIM